MSDQGTSAARAEAMVWVGCRQRGGPWFVELTGTAAAPVRIGPFDNPSLARDQARQLRAYLTALLDAVPPK